MTRQIIASLLTSWLAVALSAYGYAIARRTTGVLPVMRGLALYLVMLTIAGIGRGNSASVAVAAMIACVCLLILDATVELRLMRKQLASDGELALTISQYLMTVLVVQALTFWTQHRHEIALAANGIVRDTSSTWLPAVVAMVGLVTIVLVRRLEASAFVAASRLAYHDRTLLVSFGRRDWRVRAQMALLAGSFIGLGSLVYVSSANHAEPLHFQTYAFLPACFVSLTQRRPDVMTIAGFALTFALIEALVRAFLVPDWATSIGLAVLLAPIAYQVWRDSLR